MVPKINKKLRLIRSSWRPIFTVAVPLFVGYQVGRVYPTDYVGLFEQQPRDDYDVEEHEHEIHLLSSYVSRMLSSTRISTWRNHCHVLLEKGSEMIRDRSFLEYRTTISLQIVSIFILVVVTVVSFTVMQLRKQRKKRHHPSRISSKDNRSRIRTLLHSIVLATIAFLTGCYAGNRYPVLDAEVKDVLSPVSVMTWNSTWRMNGMVSLEGVSATMGNISLVPYRHVISLGALLVVMFPLAIMLRPSMQWLKEQGWWSRLRLRPDTKGDDGMEILRTNRRRSATFDFFGTNIDQPRERLLSSSSRGERMDFRRERMGSMDLFFSQREVMRRDHHQRSTRMLSCTSSHPTEAATETVSSSRDEDDGYLFDEFGLVTLSYDLVYHGPSQTSLRYATWTPPTSWSEVSRQIVPQDIMLKLRRSLDIDLNQGCLSIKEPKSNRKWELSLPVHDFSIHVQQPAEGAVLNLYVKSAKKEDCKEYTFESAQHAAQFQLDLLAYQMLGKSLNNMFQSLSLIHSGSLASQQPEPVLHYADSLDETEAPERTSATAAVAWDDAMRALSSIPTIRIALERCWLHHCRPENRFPARKKREKSSSSGAISSVETNLLTEEYSGKRLLLGPVDFFRLFVPALADTAVPHTGSNRVRMEQLLSWRKRVARASVLTRAYVAAHRVVNSGWELCISEDESSERLRRRLAFDDNEHNSRRDRTGKNEIYEASVSRDVLCHVRPFDYFSQVGATFKGERPLVLSPFQAYALVGVHVFQIPEALDASFPLNSWHDPVEAIPSLRKIIAGNPDVDFFVSSYYRVDTVTILLHARTLAKGVDPQFDKVMTRFSESGSDIRDRKVHVMIQMGHSNTLSFFGVILVRILSFVFSSNREGRQSPLSLQARRDRVPFPGIRLACCGETVHFGGAMRRNNDLPTNYVGMSTNLQRQNSGALLCYLERQISQRVLDFTLVLEGENEDELPERAFCTARLVRVDARAVARDTTMYDFVSPDRSAQAASGARPSKSWSQRFVREIASSVRNSILTPKKQQSPTRVNTNSIKELDVRDRVAQLAAVPSLDDSMRQAIGEIWRILEGIKVPVLPSTKSGRPLTDGNPNRPGGSGDKVMTPVSDKLTWHDIRRFILATDYDLQKAAVRLVETTAWRGQMFPTDTRMCRIELQSGQVFSHGRDVCGNPVVYFRTMCRGPWRQSPKATLAAALHRFEAAVSAFSRIEQDTKCTEQDTKFTLVIILGRPGVSLDSDEDGNTLSSMNDEAPSMVDDEADEESPGTTSLDTSQEETVVSEGGLRTMTNPRLSEDEPWHLHCTSELLEEFIALLFTHYPERLARILLVKGKYRKAVFYRTQVAASAAMKRTMITRKHRSIIRFVPKMSRLTAMINESELSIVALGKAPIPSRVFEC